MAVWSNRLILIFSSVGIFVAGVLSYAARYAKDVPCGGKMGCAIIQNHPLSKVTGTQIPVAYVGLLGFVILFALAVARSTQSGSIHRTLSVLGLIGSGLGLLYSGYLTYMSVTVIHETCIWCLASLGMIFVVTVLHGAVLQADDPDVIDSSVSFKVGAVALVLSLGALGIQSANLEKQINYADLLVQTEKYNIDEILPEEARRIGDNDAKVTLIEFADINCPTCRASYQNTKKLIEKYEGRVRFAFCHYPLFQQQGHETSLNAAIISEIAAQKGQFWKFMDTIMSERYTQRIRTHDGLIAVAADAGFSRAEMLRVLNPLTEEAKEQKTALLKQIADDMDRANSIGITGTPTFLLYAEGLPSRVVSSRKLELELEEPAIKRLIVGE